MDVCQLKTVSTEGFTPYPSGQYVAKNNCTRRIRDGKEWERTRKPLIFFGDCNFRKAITYVLAESPIRNAEAMRSTPLPEACRKLEVGVDNIRLNVRQGLTSILHFRQCKLPNARESGESGVK